MPNIKEKLSEGWLHAVLVIEVLGKPADYIEKVLNLSVDKLAQEKNLELIEKKVHEAKKVEVEQVKDVFTTFAEIEILVNNFSKLIEIIFDYMPSSVEIVEPSSIAFKIEDANALLNDLAARLHQYDAITKKLRLEHEILAKKLEEKEKRK